ncbi:MAG: methyltransferase domain-containing protein [Acidobacteriota bacterium]
MKTRFGSIRFGLRDLAVGPGIALAVAMALLSLSRGGLIHWEAVGPASEAPAGAAAAAACQDSSEEGKKSARAEEVARIAELLGLKPGMIVADIGAGDGSIAVELAVQVGEGGMVLATEVVPLLVEKMESRFRTAGFHENNLSALLGNQQDLGLQADCCDAILVRLVYHHFADRPAMISSLRRSLKPHGLIAVIETKKSQGNWHSYAQDQLIEEMEEGGFQLVRRFEDWGRDMNFKVLEGKVLHCSLFRKAKEGF